MIKLLLKFAEESREIELGDAAVTIGRSSENLIALADKKASRKHAQIEKTEPRPSCQPTVRSQNPRSACSGCGSKKMIENAASVARTNAMQ